MLRQNVIPFWKEIFVGFKMEPNIKKNSLYFSSYNPVYWRFSEANCHAHFGTCADIVSYLCKFETKWHKILNASLRYIDKVACRKKFI